MWRAVARRLAMQGLAMPLPLRVMLPFARRDSMPELPEVETLVRGLRAHLTGRRIVAVRLGKTDFIDDPAALERDLPGKRIQTVDRYGKFLLLRLEAPNAAPKETTEDADGRYSLVVHLGMTGGLTPQHPDQPVALHTHAFFSLDDGRELRYTDIRRFGRLILVPEAALKDFFCKLGLDPLDTTEEEFRRRLAGRSAMIKALLLDQRSEEHTSELQSQSNLVCRLLLEKKKKHQ